MDIKEKVEAYMDLLRIHFAPVWPILFLSGLFLAYSDGGDFSWSFTIKVAFIGLTGFLAGMVLNDIVDRKLDIKDIEFDKLVKYWRPFNEIPLVTGRVSEKEAKGLFLTLVLITSILIFTLSYPNNLILFGIMLYGYLMEYFYQIKKRKQKYPIAQILGRTDFALFPVAGYLCLNLPDLTALTYLIFFYPLALAHLGLNDIVDIKNDFVKDMKTIPILYGKDGTVRWIATFSILHILTVPFFLSFMGTAAMIGFSISVVLIATANVLLYRNRTSKTGLKVLPLFHMSVLIYSLSMILDFVLF